MDKRVLTNKNVIMENLKKIIEKNKGNKERILEATRAYKIRTSFPFVVKVGEQKMFCQGLMLNYFTYYNYGVCPWPFSRMIPSIEWNIPFGEAIHISTNELKEEVDNFTFDITLAAGLGRSLVWKFKDKEIRDEVRQLIIQTCGLFHGKNKDKRIEYKFESTSDLVNDLRGRSWDNQKNILQNMELMFDENPTTITNPYVMGFTLPGSDEVKTSGPTTCNSKGILGIQRAKNEDAVSLTFSYEYSVPSIYLKKGSEIKTSEKDIYEMGYRLETDSDFVVTKVIKNAFVLTIADMRESHWIFESREARDMYANALEKIIEVLNE